MNPEKLLQDIVFDLRHLNERNTQLVGYNSTVSAHGEMSSTFEVRALLPSGVFKIHMTKTRDRMPPFLAGKKAEVFDWVSEDEPLKKKYSRPRKKKVNGNGRLGMKDPRTEARKKAKEFLHELKKV